MTKTMIQCVSKQALTFSLTVAIFLHSCSPSTSVTEDAPQNASWEKLGPGGGGSTFMPVFFPTDPENFIVRCDMTGTYFTKDGGESYSQTNFANGSSAYAYDPSNINTIYAGNVALHRSDDGGQSWQQIFPKHQDVITATYSGDHATFRLKTEDGSLYPQDGGSVDNIRIDPANSDRIYFTMDRYFFHSADQGKTWLRESLPSRPIHLYVKNDQRNDNVFVFTAESLYAFDKDKNAFTERPLPKAMSPAFSFTAGTVSGTDRVIMYGLHNEGDTDPGDEFGNTFLWLSQDEGQTWKRANDKVLSNDPGGLTPSYSMIACAEQDALHAYIVCNRYEEKKPDGKTAYWYGALKTGDGGVTWQWVWKGGGGSGQYGVKDGTGVANLQDAWSEAAFGGEYIRLLDAGVYPRDGNVAVVTDWYRTMKTTDGGKTWKEVYSMRQPDSSYVTRGMDVTTNYGVHFDPFDSSHIAISYTDIGYHHSFNGGKSWFRSVQGVPAEWVNTCYWVAFDPEVKGKVWSAWSGLHDFPRGKMTRNPGWKKYARGGICVSTDGGKTWKPSNEGMGFDAPSTSIVMDKRSAPGQRTLYATAFNKGVFKSTDDGKTWTLKNNGIDDNTAAFELTIQDNGNLFLTIVPTPVHRDGKPGLEYYPGAVYKSTDGAENWTKLNVSDGLIFPNGVGTDPANPQRVYLGCWSDITLSDLIGGAAIRQTGGENKTLHTPGGIFLSEDGGETWKSVFDEKQYVYDVTVDPYHPGRVYCNTFNQVAWRSDDYGKTWQKLEGYDFHWGHRVIVDENNPGKVYLTTYGSSVWHGKPVINK